MKDKRKNLAELKQILQNTDSDLRVVFTNGCFDLLHIGHIRYLYRAKELGDLLIVGVNGDQSVSNLKGKGRPIVTAEERAEILASLEMIDYVIIFNELTAAGLLRGIKPDIYAKGGDYNQDNLPELPVVKEYGGKVEFISLTEGRSTSELIERIRGKNHALSETESKRKEEKRKRVR